MSDRIAVTKPLKVCYFTMKKKINLLTTLIILALSTLIILTSLNQRVVAATKIYECSNATLLGTYGVHFQGFVVTGDSYTPINGTSSITFDGQGGYTAKHRFISLGGKTEEAPASGTYKVLPDCSFTAEGTSIAGVPNAQAAVIVDGGREFFGSSTAPGFNLNTIGKRIVPSANYPSFITTMR